MDKFQIVEVGENFNHAGTKATADITLCAEKLGFKKVYVRMNTVKDSKIAKVQRQIGYYKDWKKCLNEIDDNAIVLMQHPFHHKQLTREKTLKKLKEENIDILKIYFCPHNEKDHCHCKKPKPGMIEQAKKDFLIDMNNSIYIGDSHVDYLLAKHFNLTFYGINYHDDNVKSYHSILDISKQIKKIQNK